ncbi:MAG: ATP-binding protein [Rhodospirillaceae bacterium]|nr:ATP-binding protein [Rhodospirillaceae bacterium]MYF86476.1 ATP-binding protein [Rhodospirillaceae bacterium]MYH38156.1 ATP-binding protein [Rhodospirillaceae bacterium]MYK14785.1 ATP-binding protein [Rhodospirillaceae bacterium]
MTSVLTKPADRIDTDDVQALIDESVPEGAQIEFKESLPAGKGKTDAWLNGGKEIGKYAKERILEETVAFANAFGGALVLGVAESASKPSVAARITPLPRCAELADRFRQVFRDCVEPQLQALDIVSVPTEGNSGVIVFRTVRSRRGPHRVKLTLECTVRRDDRCQTLNMREIQDMTLNLARGTERLERRLRERSKRFEGEFKRLETPDDAFGFRMTAIPIGDEIRFESVYSGGNLIEELRPPEIEVGRGSSDPNSRLRTIRSAHFMHLQDWRPRLRAARVQEILADDRRALMHAYAEIHADGLLEWGFVSNRPWRFSNDQELSPGLNFDSETPVSTLALLLVWADKVRQRASAPGAEYAIQPQFRVTADRVGVGGNDHGIVVGTIERNDTDFPLYPLEDSSEIDRTVSRFETDFWNYFGQDPGWRSREPLVIDQA